MSQIEKRICYFRIFSHFCVMIKMEFKSERPVFPYEYYCFPTGGFPLEAGIYVSFGRNGTLAGMRGGFFTDSFGCLAGNGIGCILLFGFGLCAQAPEKISYSNIRWNAYNLVRRLGSPQHYNFPCACTSGAGTPKACPKAFWIV